LQPIDDTAERGEIAVEPARRLADDDVEFGGRGIGAVVARKGKSAGAMDDFR